MNPPQGTALIDAGFTGDIELWESFEYPTDALLQAEWIEGGGAANPTRSATSYYGQYGMQVGVTVSLGSIHRLLTARNMKTLSNLAISARSNKVGGDTFRFTLYDSSGNYSYWTQTIAAQDTWETFNINPHSARSGGSATLVDLEDIVKIDLANLTASSTYIFDLIMFESLVASKIGVGYDGLDDNPEESSSVRGHMLLINDNIEVPVKDATTDVHARDVAGKKDDTAITTVGTTKSLMAYMKGVLNQIATAITDIGTVDTVVDAIKVSTDKQSGESPTTGVAIQNWNASESDIVSIGTTDPKKFIHSLLLSIGGITAGSVITIRMYIRINGIKRKVYDQPYTKGTDPDGIWVIDGTVGIHDTLQVTAQSDTASDNGKGIEYNVMTEVM